MADEKKERPIIIKKIRKGGGGGHHGGAWKVAYADFVTAMMAFFLLLWLLSQVPTSKLTGIANYFTPTAGLSGQSGDTGAGGQGTQDIGLAKDATAGVKIIQGAPDVQGEVKQAPQTIVEEEKQQDGLSISENTAEKIAEAVEKKKFDEIAEDLQKQIDENPDLKGFSKNIKIDQTEQGLRIQITELDGMSMFQVGGSKLNIKVEPLLAKVAEVVQKVDNKVTITGHTDARGYGTSADYTNWELSADRANSSRRFLVQAGVDDDRMYKVEGMADKDHLNDKDPNASENRRISIILMKKALVPVKK